MLAAAAMSWLIKALAAKCVVTREEEQAVSTAESQQVVSVKFSHV